MENREITFKDGAKLVVSVFPSVNHRKISIICLPAMGVRASYYKEFAIELQSKDFNVVTADWRGHGESSVKASRKQNFGYQRLINDLLELWLYVNDWFSASDVFIVGHSLGGQIGSLFVGRYPNKVAGLVLITAGSGYFKGWKGFQTFKLLIAGTLFYPVSKILGYFPGDIIGFGGREASGVMKDWSHDIIKGKYEPYGSDFNYELAMKKAKTPVLAISLANDFLASKQAVINLYKKIGNPSAVVHHHIPAETVRKERLDHFNWAKKKIESIAGIIDVWMLYEVPLIKSKTSSISDK